MQQRDLTGQRFGRLVALSIDHKKKGQAYWLCQCDCGNQHVVRQSHLTSGRIRSCGCLYKGKKRGTSRPPKYIVRGDYVQGTDFKGNRFFFSLQDFDLVRPYNWYCNHDGYVVARIKGKNRTMHTLILGAFGIDHINQDKADNRRENIRRVTACENASNRQKCMGMQPAMGVYWLPRNCRYIANITYRHRRINLGLYKEYDDALRARLIAEAYYLREFAPQKHLFQQYGIEVDTYRQTASLPNGAQLYPIADDSELCGESDSASA